MKLKWWIECDREGEWVIDDDEWNDLSERGRIDLLNEMMQHEMDNNVQAGYDVTEPPAKPKRKRKVK